MSVSKKMSNREFAAKMLELTNTERKEGKGIAQIYINGKPVIDDWFDTLEVAFAYHVEKSEEAGEHE